MSVRTVQSLQAKQGVPGFDVGLDGFPRPGQVVRYFRQRKLRADGKPWTQRDLAQVLGKQELAVREMELRDSGLNDIARRRLLAQLLDIPPNLLGLAKAPERQDTEAAAMWWVKQGFPMFDADPDGFPRPGQVIRHFRQRKLKADGKPWTQRDLAQVLGKQELAIRDLELRDIGLNDISRRRFLTHLFDIPPLLLGLAAVPQQYNTSRQSASIPAPTALSVSKHIDLEEVRDKLTGFWTKNVCDPQDVLMPIDSLLKKLYERYPTTASHERLEVVTALCELHIHASNILRDRGRFSKSLEHLNKTQDLNTILQEPELQADVLYRRGGVYLEKREIALALDDYHAAEQVLPNVSAPLQAAVLLETALSEARIATSQQQRTAALKKLDRAGHLIRVEHTELGRESWPYLNVDIGRYHLDRSATLIAIGIPQEALRELDLLSASTLGGRRLVYQLILQAQAYFGLKEYVQAALLAEEALPLASKVRSRVNLERIKALYKNLQQTPFQNNPEVGRLGYLLFEA
jgi:tetratricopeptide (TPR) repeat protein/transcriptional regulator with XRE-family HTH domain